MKFKVGIEKLKKGWQLSLPVSSEREGRALITELQDRDKQGGLTGKKLAKLKGEIRKQKKNLSVSVYRSKLKQATELVKEQFFRYRDQLEAGSR